MKMCFRLVLAAAWALAMTCLANAAPQYNFSDLGTLGGAESSAFDLNDLGQVVGYATLTDGSRRAFLYDTSSGMKNLGSLGTSWSMAYGINNLGQVVGSVGNDVFIHENGTMTAIDIPGSGSIGMAINDQGLIVAKSFVDGTLDPAFVGMFGHKPFQIAGGVASMLPLPAGTPGNAIIGVNGMNNSGMIVGSGTATPAIWNAPDGFVSAFSASLSAALNDSLRDVVLTDVNESGAVSGFALSTSFHWISFIYANDSLQVLTSSIQNVFINDAGQAAYNGWLLDSDGQSYGLSSITYGLNGFVLGTVAGINDQGQIIGTGTTAGGDMHAFLLTPVPEPGSFTLLLAAGSWLIAARRRRAATGM